MDQYLCSGVIRTLRQDPSELGALPLRSIEEGKLLFHTVERDDGIGEMQRLPGSEERVVLREMERQLEECGLCLRQGDKLVFASHCGRDRPRIVNHLVGHSEKAQRLRHYVCLHCYTPQGNSEVLMQKLLRVRKASCSRLL